MSERKNYDCNWCGGLHPDFICPQSQLPVSDLVAPSSEPPQDVANQPSGEGELL